jgi:hypothetical protein
VADKFNSIEKYVVSTLMEHRLLDELRLWVHPVVIRRAKPEDLLHRDCPSTRFDLVDTTALDSGIAILTYPRDGS